MDRSIKGVAAICSRRTNLFRQARRLLATAGESLAEPLAYPTWSIQNSASMRKCVQTIAEAALLGALSRVNRVATWSLICSLVSTS